MGGLGNGSNDPAEEEDDDDDDDDGENDLPWYGKIDPRFVGDGSDYREHFDYTNAGSGNEDGENTKDET